MADTIDTMRSVNDIEIPWIESFWIQEVNLTRFVFVIQVFVRKVHMTEVWKADELKFHLPVMYDGRYILLPGGLQCGFSNFLAETKHA